MLIKHYPQRLHSKVFKDDEAPTALGIGKNGMSANSR
jgi:hypothetical protein